MHFTPTSGSWLDMVEIFFAVITRQAIRRGTFGPDVTVTLRSILLSSIAVPHRPKWACGWSVPLGHFSRQSL